MFTSMREPRESDGADPSERLRFVAGWFRALGLVLVGLWILAGVAVVIGGLATDREAAPLIVLLGAGGAAVGILLTAPLYFWFAAIAAGVAALVDHAAAKGP